MSDETVDVLMARGLELIQEQDFEGAVEVGEQLQAVRHSSAFEILALAHTGLGNTERAVEVLEDGTKKAPEDWALWQLLGNARAELERYDKGHEAYKKALACPDVDESSVHLNVCIALACEERFDEAIAAMSGIDDDELLLQAESLRYGIYNSQKKFDEVIDGGEKMLARLTAEDDDEVRATVQAHVGEAYWKGRDDKEKALELAWTALGICHALDEALWLIRAVDGQVSREANYYRLLIGGDWHEPDEDGKALGFFITYDVVADDVAEALMFVRPFEPEQVGESLKVSESEVLEEHLTEPKGVYTYSGHSMFPREGDDESQPSGEDS